MGEEALPHIVPLFSLLPCFLAVSSTRLDLAKLDSLNSTQVKSNQVKPYYNHPPYPHPNTYPLNIPSHPIPSTRPDQTRSDWKHNTNPENGQSKYEDNPPRCRLPVSSSLRSVLFLCISTFGVCCFLSIRRMYMYMLGRTFLGR